MKNSSRLVEKIERNFRGSRTGRVSSVASSRTLRLNSTQLSSLLKNGHSITGASLSAARGLRRVRAGFAFGSFVRFAAVCVIGENGLDYRTAAKTCKKNTC